MNTQDTIVALATAAGTAAIAVVRLSGDESISIVEKFFRSKTDKKISESRPNRVYFGEIIENDNVIDEVLVTIFKAPHSYTGQNSVEISCHGSIFIQQKILELATQNGARLADAGEYTMRAFLNGKLDLSQAEAVADLIASKSNAAARVAMSQLKGGFSDELKLLRAELIDFVSLIELELDFSEEDVEFADRQKLTQLISKIRNKIKSLINSFEYGNAIKNGIPVAIVGQPNVGKSTLLNTLLKEDKAIVSDIEGTTRDSIEDTISIYGTMFRFIDTAGLRKTDDTVENLGIERTIEKVKKAEVVLYILDATKDAKMGLYDELKPYLRNKKMIAVLNKIDKADTKKETLDFSELTDYEIVEISAKNNLNINKLEQALLDATKLNSFDENDIIVTNTRHLEALNKSFEASERVVEALTQGLSSDLLSFDIRQMLEFLGEITGEVTNDEILGNIFSKFCIGK